MGKQGRSILDRVFVKLNLICKTIIELPYYTAGHDNICIHCGDDTNLTIKEHQYPMCVKCIRDKKPPKKRKCGKAPNK